MKKLTLGKFNLRSEEILERNQLSMVFGGSGSSGSTSGCYFYTCGCANGDVFQVHTSANPYTAAPCSNGYADWCECNN